MLLVLAVAKAVGHAGQVIADGAWQADGPSAILKVGREQLRAARITGEHLAQSLLGLGAHRDQSRGAVQHD